MRIASLRNRASNLRADTITKGAIVAFGLGTVITLGLITLPTLLKRGYDPGIACGAICASGTLGQIIPPSLILILLADILQLSVGTLFAAMSVNTRTREVMLPVLLFPVVVPVLIAAVKSTGSVLSQRPWDEFAHWINLLVAFDVIFFVVCLLTFDYVVEE